MSLYRFGKDAVLYHSTTALDGDTSDVQAVVTAAGYNAYDNVRDVNGDFAGTSVETTTRLAAKAGYETEENVTNKYSITFDMPELAATDAILDALISAWQARTTVNLLALNGLVTVVGNRGVGGMWSIQMTKVQPLKDVQLWSVTAMLAKYFEWYTVPTP